MWPSKQDWTKHRWFVKRRSRTQDNLLYDIIPNFSYLQRFGRNSLHGIIHYLGKNEYIDKISGYVYTWDKKATCDRCGAKLEYRGSRSIRLAYAAHIFPQMLRHGVCYKCDEEMMKQKANDEDAGLIKNYIRPRGLSYERKRIEDIYRKKYIWL